MSIKRQFIRFFAAALIPPMGAAQLLAANGGLTSGTAWVGVIAILMSSTLAAGIYLLTDLNQGAGNSPVPPSLPTAPVVAPAAPTVPATG